MTEPSAIPMSSSILLGTKTSSTSGFGFSPESPVETAGGPIVYDGDSHLMTIAPTGKGKGVSSIIPTLLEYPGSVIVFDPKGENLQITARRRREMGHQVVVLNPFNTLTEETDSLNPLDLLNLEGADIESDSQMLAQMLSEENKGVKDVFWDIHGSAVIAGMISHIATWGDQKDRSLNALHEAFHSDDVVYNFATLLDTCGKEMNQFAYREIASFLQHPERETRGSVLSTATSYLKCLSGGSVPKVLKSSSFSLQEFVDGAPLSIYIIIPTGKLSSHRGLLRILVAVLLAAVMMREDKPDIPTLFLLDEAAQLGKFRLLEQAITLCRGYGLKVWSFWQDLSQLKKNYPGSWETIFNNCDIKQIFGLSSLFQASEWSGILNQSKSGLLSMNNDEQVLVLPDGSEELCKKLSYLQEPYFAGHFDKNPRFEKKTRKRNAPDISQYRSKNDDDSSGGMRKAR